MKQSVFLTMLLVLLLCACSKDTVSKEDYDSLAAQVESLQAELDRLTEEKTESEIGEELSTEEVSVFDMDAYKTISLQLHDSIMENANRLNKIALYEETRWQVELNILGSKPATTKLRDYAFEYAEKNGGVGYSLQEYKNSELMNLYRDYVSLEIEGNEANEIDSLVRELYSSYFGFWNMVDNNTFTEIDEFHNEYTSLYSSLGATSKQLKVFLC